MSAENAAEKIAEDIRNRRGLEQTWNKIDEDIQEDILENWSNIISEEVES